MTEASAIGSRPVVVVATGPSLTQADVDAVRECVVFVVNDAYQLAPWAAILYAADGAWWNHHIERVRATFTGECWTCDEGKAREYGLHSVLIDATEGLSADPRVVRAGRNSGHQCLNLAVNLGARRIALLGFDHKPDGDRLHYFGDHPGELNRPVPFDHGIAAMRCVARDAKARGIEITNCSRETAIDAFPRMTITQWLEEFDATRVTG